MLDQETIDSMRKDRQGNMSYPALSLNYGSPVSTIEYWVGDIKPVKFNFSGTAESLSGGMPAGAFPLSRKEAVKMKKEVHFTANVAVHQSEEHAKILEMLDAIEEYVKHPRIEPESRGPGGTSYVKEESPRPTPTPEPEPQITFDQDMFELYKFNLMMQQNDYARRRAGSRELDDFMKAMILLKALERAERDAEARRWFYWHGL